MKQKFYVVWTGRETGILNSWEECQKSVIGYKGARYKAFDSYDEARAAFCDEHYLNKITEKADDKGGHDKSSPYNAPKAGQGKSSPYTVPAGCIAESLAVDAACSGNPGPMEYRAVYVRTGQQVFHFGPVYGTNNIGEFLAIVHGLALLKQKGLQMPIYSDSRNAQLWVRQKKCKTKLERTERTEQLFQLIERAEAWLRNNTYDTTILKWDTRRWGEIPADFGRK